MSKCDSGPSGGRTASGRTASGRTAGGRGRVRLVEGTRLTWQEFRAQVVALPEAQRDAHVDRWLGLTDVPEDGPALPRGCVPYWPCSVSAVLQAVERSELGPEDLVMDVGVGAGRTAVLLHALSGATVMGVEVQPHLAQAARDLAERCEVSLTVVGGDADDLDWAGPLLRDVTVFFLFCPFGGARLTRLAAAIRRVAEARLANANERCDLRVACVDTTLSLTPTFVEHETDALGLTLYRCRRTTG